MEEKLTAARAQVSEFMNKARVRQLIAVTLTALIVYETVIAKTIDATTLVGIYGTVLGFYFAEAD
tara:strand:- start:2874 stop:3068 length:195 start_codon:yes stop_codon:yes gene_type:complete